MPQPTRRRCRHPLVSRLWPAPRRCPQGGRRREDAFIARSRRSEVSLRSQGRGVRGGAPYISDTFKKERDARRRHRRQLRQRSEEGFLPEMLDHHQPVPASHRPPSNLPKTSTKPAPQSTEGSLPSAPAPAKAVPRARPTRCRALDAHHRHHHRADLTPSPSPGLGAVGHRRHAAGTAPRGDNEQAAAENPRRTPGSSHARPDPASASLPVGHRSMRAQL